VASCLAVTLFLACAVWIWRFQAVIGALRTAKAENDLRLAVEVEKAGRIQDLEASLRAKTNEAGRLSEEKADAEKQLATKTETLSITIQRLEAIKLDYDVLAAKLDTAGAEKTTLESKLADKCARLDENSRLLNGLREELRVKLTALSDSQRDLADLQIKYAKIQEMLQQETKAAGEKLALLQEAKEEMTNQFKVLGQDIMAQHGASFKKQNIEQLNELLTPLQQKLSDFQQQLASAQTENSKERATLGEQIRSVLDASARMSRETNNLTQALKGKSQTQGAWGEMILQTILRQSGLREGVEYVFQESRNDEEGSRLRPDVVVNLPSGEKVVIDSKVSLSAYVAYTNAETDGQREMELSMHLNSISKHIDALSAKEYHHLFSSQLNFVIMFIPIEGALAVALEKKPDLTGLAAKKNIALATPTTLMLALKTIANLWHVERRNRNAEEIAERAGKLYDKFVGFITDLESVGDRLTQAQTSYREAMDKLAKGKGNIVRQVERVKELGAKTGKTIPQGLLDLQETQAVPSPPTDVETYTAEMAA
jgi:DNA recombination protein RmuC